MPNITLNWSKKLERPSRRAIFGYTLCAYSADRAYRRCLEIAKEANSHAGLVGTVPMPDWPDTGTHQLWQCTEDRRGRIDIPGPASCTVRPL